MNALVVMVHGSPRPEANQTMFDVVKTLQSRPEARERFPVVRVGFMECNEPSIPDAIAECVQAGATEVVAVPYFLHTGNHVCEDLPGLMEQARATYPNVTFRLGDYIGLSPRLSDLLAERAHVVQG